MKDLIPACAGMTDKGKKTRSPFDTSGQASGRTGGPIGVNPGFVYPVTSILSPTFLFPLSAFHFPHFFQRILSKKSFPLSSVMMKAGKSLTVMR